MIVSRYTAADARGWNDINSRSRNGHFLFDRSFMDYHRDRFSDWSLIVREEEVLGLLPANRVGDTLFSHQGLTFGGIISSDRLTGSRMLKAFEAIITYLSSVGVSRLVYKPIPSIYHIRPACEDLYALFRFGAQLIKRDLSTTIDLRQRGIVSSRRVRGAKKALRNGVAYSASDRWTEFWSILGETLFDRHGVAPVHSLAEMVLLANRFPTSIRLFISTDNDAIVAGTVIFSTPTVAHAQYIAASALGKQIGALDGLFEFVIDEYRETKRFFDFGISTEAGGHRINEGLLIQKEEFGGSAITYDVYELKL